MTPKPNNQQARLNSEDQNPGRTLNGNGIVISGMSGLFPMSSNVKDFSMILYSKINPVNNSDLRWNFKHPEVSEYVGKVPDLERFDAQFFMVHERLGNSMDPMARKVLEHSYQAIYDAGLSPKHLSGKKVGVYMASSFSDTEKYGLMDSSNPSNLGYGITGVSKTMYPNRISYWLNLKGPSMTIDDASCGFMVALEEAVTAINRGIIESALVGATNLCLAPLSPLHFNRCIKISPDGKTRSFDENANGCATSEAISIVFIQKAKDALRTYAEVVHIKNEFISRLKGETGQVFGFGRNPEVSAEFLKQFYSEAHVAAKDVEYIEAFGSANPEADKAELQAIEKVFCENRTEPLLVGSVISNIGFTDSAVGATAVTKILLGYQNGLIASNLHCETPRQDIAAIRDGRMCVVTDHQPFRGTYAAVNCLSYTGVNSHLLLRGYTKPKDLNLYKTSIPRLLTISARQEEHLKYVFNNLKSGVLDPEEIALLQNIHSTNISGHLGRGYLILDTDEKRKTVTLSEKSAYSDEADRPLWFVYSGMGSQWAGMGAQLMRIPIFAAAIDRCHKILLTKGIDIVNIITSPDKSVFDNVLNCFVGIAAIQIGITDILTALGIQPDKIIGHSVGELGCAYADGCLTAEEVILSAYARGKASNDATLIRGSMAAVGLGYQQLIKSCPPSIDIACHNSSSSSTISGPEDAVRDFVTMLTANGVFARVVPSANIAYHSRYIANAGTYLMQLLSDIIREPKLRSERWLSTSVPQEKLDESSAKYCSAEYFTNNLLSPVLFEETSSLIPANAVLVEIAPHGLLQAILKRALPDSCTNIPLTQRGHRDNALFLLEAVGNLYIAGFNPQIQAIYPKIEFPVSSGTPHLSHLVKWFHSDTWRVNSAESNIKAASSREILLSIHDDEHSYLTGNIVQGNILYPSAGVLVAVWDTLAMTYGLSKQKVSVRFRDLHFNTQPMLFDQKQLSLDVALNRGSGRFEVLNEDFTLATGYIDTDFESNFDNEIELVNFEIGSEEIYEHLSGRGYSYKEAFRSIASTDELVNTAKILWNDNWVTFIDGLLQLNILKCAHEGVSQVTHIRELSIDVNKQAAAAQKLNGQAYILAKVDEVCDNTRCGGVLLQNIKFCNLPVSNHSSFELFSSSSNFDNSHIVPVAKLTADNNYILQIGNIGELDTLHWEEGPAVDDNGIPVQVEYTGITVADVKRANGKNPSDDADTFFGIDFSGTTKNGSRVMGLVRNGAARTEVCARPELLWPVPAHWTLEDAATVPLAYTQAFYYLCVKNELQRGWRVLVHGACGALGQAAISIALAHGCKVFATVADNGKKRFLLKLFPNLNEDAIGNSRDDSFGDMVLNATNGEGCNIVLSCVRDDLKNISLKCAAFSGVTIDMVQIQNRDKFEYGMFNMTRQRSYIAADFYSLLDLGSVTELKKLQLMVSEGIARGYVVPLTRVTFAPHEAARAFRLLAASRHRGRVLLTLRDQSAPVTPRVVSSSNSTHFLVWDGSSFGLKLADRLIARGVRKLRICSLNPTSRYLLKLRLWKNIGVDVETLTSLHGLMVESDDSALSDVILNESRKSPVEGIYVSVTDIDSNSPLAGKVEQLVHNLDIVSRKLESIRYFAVITAKSIIGQQLCFSRAKHGLPTTALHLPAYEDANNDSGSKIKEASWNHCAVNATERALRAKNAALFAQPQPKEVASLRRIIPTLYECDNNDASLKDLGLEESLPFVQYFLKSIYHITLDDKDAAKLTKKQILKMEREASEHKFENVQGLGVFFSIQDNDELHGTIDLVSMKTLVADNEMLMGAVNAENNHLFIIPGLEGHHARFRTLCERLKLPAMVLQPGLDYPQETPRELALRYSKILLNQFKPTANFYLLGYEFGIDVALELAAILEDHGLTGTVYCIGDGPEEMRALLEAELSAFESARALQEGVVRHVSALLSRSPPPPPGELERALRSCCSWQQRVECGVRALLGRAPHTAQYVRALLEAAHARVAAARRTPAAPRALRSRLVLLRARRDPRPAAACSLQRYSREPLLLHHLAAPLAHAAADLRAPAIVNKYLDQQLLEKFESSNLCYFYDATTRRM